MSESSYWLYNQIKNKLNVKKISKHCIEIYKDEKIITVYCPTTEEYEITYAVVQNAIHEKANIIAFPIQWCKATSSAKSYGREHGIKVIPFGKFFSEFGISS